MYIPINAFYRTNEGLVCYSRIENKSKTFLLVQFCFSGVQVIALGFQVTHTLMQSRRIAPVFPGIFMTTNCGFKESGLISGLEFYTNIKGPLTFMVRVDSHHIKLLCLN